MSTYDEELNALVRAMDGWLTRAGAGAGEGDAINDILSSPRRETATRSVRHHEAVEAFRRELSDGLIRADTANQLLRLIGTVLARLL